MNLKGFDALDKANRLMESMETTPKVDSFSNIESRHLAYDGKYYGIVKENTRFVLKVANNKNPLVSEDFDYINGAANKSRYAHKSYKDAQKQFNFMNIEFSRLHGDGLLKEALEEDEKYVLKAKKKSSPAPVDFSEPDDSMSAPSDDMGDFDMDMGDDSPDSGGDSENPDDYADVNVEELDGGKEDIQKAAGKLAQMMRDQEADDEEIEDTTQFAVGMMLPAMQTEKLSDSAKDSLRSKMDDALEGGADGGDEEGSEDLDAGAPDGDEDFDMGDDMDVKESISLRENLFLSEGKSKNNLVFGKELYEMLLAQVKKTLEKKGVQINGANITSDGQSYKITISVEYSSEYNRGTVDINIVPKGIVGMTYQIMGKKGDTYSYSKDLIEDLLHTLKQLKRKGYNILNYSVDEGSDKKTKQPIDETQSALDNIYHKVGSYAVDEPMTESFQLTKGTLKKLITERKSLQEGDTNTLRNWAKTIAAKYNTKQIDGQDQLYEVILNAMQAYGSDIEPSKLRSLLQRNIRGEYTSASQILMLVKQLMPKYMGEEVEMAQNFTESPTEALLDENIFFELEDEDDQPLNLYDVPDDKILFDLEEDEQYTPPKSSYQDIPYDKSKKKRDIGIYSQSGDMTYGYEYFHKVILGNPDFKHVQDPEMYVEYYQEKTGEPWFERDGNRYKYVWALYPIESDLEEDVYSEKPTGVKNKKYKQNYFGMDVGRIEGDDDYAGMDEETEFVVELEGDDVEKFDFGKIHKTKQEPRNPFKYRG